jgi:hypothetical protein
MKLYREKDSLQILLNSKITKYFMNFLGNLNALSDKAQNVPPQTFFKLLLSGKNLEKLEKI